MQQFVVVVVFHCHYLNNAGALSSDIVPNFLSHVDLETIQQPLHQESLQTVNPKG
jgi:hypothetical protein